MLDRKRNLPLLRMAWRNTRRNTRRTLLTVSAVTVAVAALIYGLSHVNGLLDGMLDTYARTESGHVRIRGEGYSERERALPLHLHVAHLEAVLETTRATPGVEAALPRIRTAALVDGADTNQPALLFGLDLSHEEGYLNPTAMVTAGRLPRPGQAEVMVGVGFAEKLNASVGDTLTLLGQTAYRSLGGLRATVVGLAQTGLGYLDGKIVVAPLDQVQQMAYLNDAATEVVVFAADPTQADTLVATLQAALAPLTDGALEILSWQDQGPLLRMFNTARPMLGLMMVIMLLMASLVITNTMLMTVMERTQEFGMLSALGMRRADLMALVVVEGFAIGLIGAALGSVLGTGVALWVEHNGIDLTQALKTVELPFQGVLYPDWQPLYTLLCALLGVLTAGVAALYPAWRAVQMKPAEALRP